MELKYQCSLKRQQSFSFTVISGPAAVAFMNYAGMAEILKPSNTEKIMISTVVSATLPKTANTNLTKPVSFTFMHSIASYFDLIISDEFIW